MNQKQSNAIMWHLPYFELFCTACDSMCLHLSLLKNAFRCFCSVFIEHGSWYSLFIREKKEHKMRVHDVEPKQTLNEHR